MSSRLDSSRDSQYEYNPSFVDADGEDEDGSPSLNDSSASSLPRDSRSLRSGVDDVETYLTTVNNAMAALEALHSASSSSWKQALKHKSGAVVYVTKEKKPCGGGGKPHKAPVFKGVLEIKGFTPAAVFAVVGMRKLWDDWYKEGTLVENLSDSASLTYMCMKGIAGSSTRDLSLVELVTSTSSGSIHFVSTSVVTPRVPRVAGRVRATIALNGWVMEPIEGGGTKVTYYLHVDVKTFMPNFAAVRYLARRPTCVAKIAEYLQQHGAPPMATAATAPASPPASPSIAVGRSPGSQRRGSVSSKSSRRSSTTSSATLVSSLPNHVAPDESAASFGVIERGQALFKSLLALPKADWKLTVDESERKIMRRERDGEGALPIVKGVAEIGGVTTEQVLGTIRSLTARREWDVRFLKSKTLELDNGFDQGIHLEQHKGIFPSLPAHHFAVARGVDRDDPSMDNSELLFITRSTKTAPKHFPADSQLGQIDLSGFLLTPTATSSVKITHISQMTLSSSPTRAVYKILVGELAKAPHELAEFIDDYGFAPFFLRWGEGPAELTGEKGDILRGEVEFSVAGDGSGTMRDGQQKAWLQYSEKMYPRGLAIEVDPPGAAQLAKVDGVDLTIEFVWTEAVKQGVRVALKQGEGDGAEDVFVNGEWLDHTVGVEKGRPSKAAKAAKASKNKPSPLPNGNSDEETLTGSTEELGKPSPTSKAGPILAAVASTASLTSSTVKDASSRASSSLRDASSTLTSAVAPGTRGAPSDFPADACLIISKDLYFTRPQCAFMALFIVFAYLWGKLA